jgi:hypothetical protein
MNEPFVAYLNNITGEMGQQGTGRGKRFDRGFTGRVRKIREIRRENTEDGSKQNSQGIDRPFPLVPAGPSRECP